MSKANSRVTNRDEYRNNINVLVPAIVFLLALIAQTAEAQHLSPSESSGSVGDSPEISLPLARDLSPALRTKDVEKAIRKVADWQMDRIRDDLNQDWTFAVLEIGLLAASDAVHETAYREAVERLGEANNWQLGKRSAHADDQAVGQAYLALYRYYKKPEIIVPMKQQFDRLKNAPDNPSAPVWWWCDALFMAPPVWIGIYQATGDRSYLDYMDRQWWITSRKLFDDKEHLFSRDSHYLTRTEANGRKLFWLRGNGWVLAGLARVLESVPIDYPSRSKYRQMFLDMAQRLASLQEEDGLWRPGLLDEQNYMLPETSGSALVTYALAWGINNGYLSPSIYAPIIEKAWKGLVSHIYQDGRLGCIQPVGEKPGAFRPTSSYVYGVGAFLLAGLEIDHYAARLQR